MISLFHSRDNNLYKEKAIVVFSPYPSFFARFFIIFLTYILRFIL
ncbi:putative membrane protein [Raoultella ornithinolytica 2-156-04_S1_C2]|nr:putative membrane protein [Raoultella ornithinolytica 2-156-04_S1_C1]KDX12736.1 putative membrane protein [Raoultella ornithinolytica 2-156-04_S1_C2]